MAGPNEIRVVAVSDEETYEGQGSHRCSYDGTLASSMSIEVPEDRIEVIGKLISPDGTVRKIARIELMPGVEEIRYEVKMPLYDIDQVSVQPMESDKPIGLSLLEMEFGDVDE